MRAAVFKHGRYSRIERDLAALVQSLNTEIASLAATTRDPFWRRLYTGRVRPLSAAQIDSMRDRLIGGDDQADD